MISGIEEVQKFPHEWISADHLGHGTAQCRYCKGTAEELRALDKLDFCDKNPHYLKPRCRHLRARIKEYDPVMTMYCDDCGTRISVSTVLNCWFDELNEVRAQQHRDSQGIQEIVGHMRELLKLLEEQVKI